MSNLDDGYRKDYFFSFLAVFCWIGAFGLLFPAVWVDWRWMLTAVLLFIVGLAFAAFSMALDKRYRERGIRE